MTRGLRLSGVVVFAAVATAIDGRAAEEIDTADFDNPTQVTFDGLSFGESITDQFGGVDFGGSLFASAPNAAAGPAGGDTVAVEFETPQTRVGFDLFPGPSVSAVRAVFFRSGSAEPTGSLTVGFSPGEWTSFGAEDTQGIDSMTLELTADQVGGTLSLFDNFLFESVTATGPRISIEPVRVDFLNVLVGESSTESVTVANHGTEDLHVTAISDPGGDLAVSAPALPLTLAPGEGSSFDITYAPAEVGDDAATIAIESDDPGGQVEVTVEANAVGVAVIQVDPNRLDFGGVLLGDSRVESFTVINSGTDALNITGIDDPGGDFSLVPITPGPLAPGASLNVAIGYAPSETGTDAATITVESDVGNVVVTLTGEGITSTSSVVVEPDHIAFGDVFVGSFAETPIIITNPGDAALKITGITLEGGAAPPNGPFDLPLFSSDFPPGFPLTIAPGASKSLMVRFAPTDTIASIDQVEIETNAPGQSKTVVPLSGAGVAELVPEIHVFPTTLTYGGRYLEVASQESVTVRNIGTGMLIINSVALVQSSSAFRITGVPGEAVRLEPGAALELPVIFTPLRTGHHGGTVVITSSDEDEPEVRVSLAGVGLFQNKPEIEVEPLKLDYGEQFVGAESTETVIVRNVGTLDLEITSIQIGAGSAADFSVGGDLAFVLGGGTERAVEVTFAPTDVVVASGTVRIHSNDADEPVTTVSLEGRGIPVPKPRITVRTPPTLLFSEVLVGTSSSLRATIQNTGVAPLKVSGISLGAETTPEFQVTEGPESVDLVPGAEISIEVTYTPEKAGLDSGVLRIRSDDEIEPLVNVALLGIGVGEPVPEITVFTETPTADYGLVEVGNASALVVTVLNSGSANLDVTSVSLSAETSVEFTITGGPESVSIAPGAHVDIEVTYTPADVGFDSGTLVIESLDADESISTVALSGTGAPVPVQRITVASRTLDYGDVQVGAALTRRLTVTNTGTANLDVRAIRVTAGSSPAFDITAGPDSVNLAPGAEFTVEVTYRPVAAVTDSGLLQLSSDDSEEPVVSVSLSGTGVTLPMARVEIDRPALDFGDVAIGVRSVLGLTIRNVGATNLAVTSIGLGQGSSAAFTITSGGSVAILRPGGETLVELTYEPTAAVTDSGTLRIASSDLEDPEISVSLSGTGVVNPLPRIAFVPPVVDFGMVDIGADSTRTLTIRNVGSAVLRLSTIALGDGSSARFAIASGPGSLQLNPGAETTVDITYTPNYPRVDSATLRVASNDKRHPTTLVSLLGVAVGDVMEDLFKRGDSNRDGDVNISDAVATLTYLFGGGVRPGCFDAADANGDNSLDLSDALYTLNHLFSGGARVTALGTRCDADSSPDGLPPCEYPPDLCE